MRKVHALRRLWIVILSLGGLSLGLLPAATAAAGPYYVSPTPNCSNTGPGSLTTPFCTINTATQKMVAGETTYVMAGTYTETVSFKNSGSAAAPITLQAYPGSTPVLANSSADAITISSKAYVIIDGLTIQTPTGKCIYASGGGNHTVRNVTCSGAGQPVSGQTKHGIQFNSTSGGTIAHNTSYNNTDAGIAVTGTASNVQVIGNLTYGNARGYTRAAPGIDIRATGGGIVIEQNISHDYEDSGIQIYNGPVNTVVRSNLTY